MKRNAENVAKLRTAFQCWIQEQLTDVKGIEPFEQAGRVVDRLWPEVGERITAELKEAGAR